MPCSRNTTELMERLRGGLVVSCQPVPDGPFDNVDAILAYARIAQAGGAVALRIEGAANVAAVARHVGLPVIGLIKRDLEDSAIRITPFEKDVEALVRAGAAIVAIDATDRPRPVPSAALVAAVRRLGAVAMADIATEAEARAALAAGADILATTMSGYAGPEPAPVLPDIELVRRCAGLGAPVVAEGRYNTPGLAARAIRAGAHAVVVGSAITRPEHAVAWFRAAVERAARPAGPALAFDIGGTKTLACLVRGAEILDRRLVTTRRGIGAPGWIEDIAALAADWHGAYNHAAAAVTGVVVDGKWSALNADTLAVPENFPLESLLGEAIGMPVVAVNDAQAAAWGEYRFGAAQGRDMAFVTISSGVGGGIVLGGRLLRGANGLAGSLGQTPWRGSGGLARLESLASGFGIAAAAARHGREGDARAVFDASRAGEAWAEAILDETATELAAALYGLQMLVDPQCIVIGGGVGLADGFLRRLERALSALAGPARPVLLPPALGVDAGVIGVADLAANGG